MNTNILTKCLTELEKPTPDVSYLRGMIETLISISGAPVAAPISNAYTQPVGTTYFKSDEQEEIPAAARPGPIGRIN